MILPPTALPEEILLNPDFQAYIEEGANSVHNIIRQRIDIGRDFYRAHQEWMVQGRQRNRRLVRVLRRLGRHEQADRVDFCRTACRRRDGSSFLYSCHQPLCFFCTYQRKAVLTPRWSLAACSIERAYFMTLTMRDERYLSGVYDRMVADFQRLRRLKHFREHCQGGFYCLECSYSPSRDRFHPHIHALLQADGLSSSWLSRTWRHYTSAYVIDLREVPRGEIKRTFLYMLKGPCRSLEPRAVSEVYSSLGGKALFQPFGIVKRRHALCRACRESKSKILFGETCAHGEHWK